MSMYVNNADKELGQFASNAGYADLIEASKKNTLLKMFFAAASADGKDVVEDVCDSLRDLNGSADVESTANTLADLMEGEDLVYITDGTHDGDDTNKGYGDDNADEVDENEMHEEPEDADVPTDKFEIRGQVVKLADRADHKRIVFGFFSVVSINGTTIEDTQGDMITDDTLEAAAYEFVLNERKGGEMHESGTDGEVRGIGRLVESVVLTHEKQHAMVACLQAQGINATMELGCVCWWGGFYVDNQDTWDKVTSGELKAFSIGGRGKRAAV